MRSLVCVGVGLWHMSLYHSAPAIADSSVASVWSGYRGLGIKDRVGRLPSSHPVPYPLSIASETHLM